MYKMNFSFVYNNCFGVKIVNYNFLAMPPKKQPGPSKKTEEKKKDKIIEDKTFGLKKTRKNLKFIQQVQQQVSLIVSSRMTV